jgi:hypothetical protein
MTNEEEIALGKELAACAGDPLKFVETMFPWDSDPELKGAAPEKWQREVLEAIRDGLPEEKVRIARASGHGVGKTALTSWIILWALAPALTMISPDVAIISLSRTITPGPAKRWRVCRCRKRRGAIMPKVGPDSAKSTNRYDRPD